jgi:hypothetical protein
VGGSFVLMAASCPSIRDQVAFIGAFAPYSSMWTLAKEIASRTRTCEDQSEPWEVDPLTRKVYVRSLTAVLDPAEAEQLRESLNDENGSIDSPDLSKDGQAVYPLLTKLDLREADVALRRLPAPMQKRLATMSPTSYLDDIHAPLIVLCHDRDDAVIPISESRRFWSALKGRTGVHYTEFAMFKHLDPSKVKLSAAPLIRELVKFYLAMYPMFRQATAK